MQTMPSKPNHFEMHVKQSLCWFYACAFPAAIDATNFWHSLKYFFDIFPWIKCTLKKFSWYPWLTVNAFDTQFAKIEFEYPGKSTYLCNVQQKKHQQHQHQHHRQWQRSKTEDCETLFGDYRSRWIKDSRYFAQVVC